MYVYIFFYIKVHNDQVQYPFRFWIVLDGQDKSNDQSW